MQKVIDIPGHGEVEFPDTMSDAEINAAAKRLFEQKRPAGASGSWQMPPKPNPYEAAARVVVEPVAKLGMGVTEGARGLAGMPGAIMDAAGRPPETESEQLINAGAGGLGLAAKRMIVDPQVAEYEKGKASDTLLGKVQHYLAAGAPMVGPYASYLIDKAKGGEGWEALGEGLFSVAAPGMIAKSPQAARAGLNKVTTPEARMVRANALRSGETGITGVAGDILGALRGHPAAIVAGKAVRRVGQPYRNVKAGLQERVAKFMAAGDKPPSFAAVRPRFQGEATVPPTPASAAPFTYRGPAERMPQERAPIPSEPIERVPYQSPVGPRIEQQGPYAPPLSQVEQVRQLRQAGAAADESPFAAGATKPPAEAGSPMPNDIPPLTAGMAPLRIQTTQQAIAPIAAYQNIVGTTQFIDDLHKAAPEIRSLGKGPAFDKALFDSFKRVEENVIQADAMIPDTVTVPMSKIVDGMEALAADFEIKGWDKSAAAIRKEAASWMDTLPEQIPWRQFSTLKKHFLRETSKASSQMRQAYSVLREVAEQVTDSDALKQANRDYSTVRTAMDAAKMNLKEGFRIRQVGKTLAEMKVEKVKGLRGGPL